MLTPAASQNDPTLFPETLLLSNSTTTAPVALAADQGGTTMACGMGAPTIDPAAAEGTGFAEMLTTLLAPAETGASASAAGGLVPMPPSALVASPWQPVGPATLEAQAAPEKARGEGDTTSDTVEGDDHVAAGEDNSDDEEAALLPEDALAAGWMFLPPPPAPTSPSPSRVRSASDDAIASENAVESTGLRESSAPLPEAPRWLPEGTTVSRRAFTPREGSAVVESSTVPVADVIASMPAEATPKTALGPLAAPLRELSSGAREFPATPVTMPVTKAYRYPVVGDTVNAEPGVGLPAVAPDLTPSKVTAQFAGNALPVVRGMRDAGKVEGEKNAQEAVVEILAGPGESVGIEPAKASPRMPAENFQVLPTAAETAQVAAPAASEAGGSTEAVHAVEKVLDAAEMLAPSGRTSVQLRLDCGDAGPLTVQVSLREGEVHAVFRSDSAEMRETLAAAWSQLTSGRDQASAFTPVAEPEFLPLREVAPASGATGGGSLHSQADTHSGGRQQASEHAAAGFAPPARPRAPAHATASSGNERADTPRAATSSSHLSAFA